ncbi:hypothetical protein SISNIDRAFT_547688 [Sistotremastrum niveocremeum HHB9708]|uniref:Zn(2)-C6 fungal-type domain-containing protein n=1 Tax=Sistotremastrum niveocremeum HHB9708 TaxID=1314777 RepID=A0A164XR30_9AGAM|nr:hypothetical protein SISNIDRAFT_547688 [Sistotremastrum niveocremeum HHB9708]
MSEAQGATADQVAQQGHVRTPTPDGTQVPEQQQPSGNPFPPPGYQAYYTYPPHDAPPGDGSAPANGAPPYYPYVGPMGTVYAYPGQPNTGGYNPMTLPSTLPISQGMQRSKRKQVKNACTNCATACKRCDNARPCERCKKYGIEATCQDSARKERKKGVKRGPYKRKSKVSNSGFDDPNSNPEGDWSPAGVPNGDPNAVPQLPQGQPPYPEGYYPYYPYPMPMPGQEGAPPGNPPDPSGNGAFPPPPQFYAHLHPAAYPPYPPWQHQPYQPHPGQPGDPTQPPPEGTVAPHPMTVSGSGLLKEDDPTAVAGEHQAAGDIAAVAVALDAAITAAKPPKKKGSKKKDDDGKKKSPNLGRTGKSSKRRAEEGKAEGAGPQGALDAALGAIDPSVTSGQDGASGDGVTVGPS